MARINDNDLVFLRVIRQGEIDGDMRANQAPMMPPEIRLHDKGLLKVKGRTIHTTLKGRLRLFLADNFNL